MIYSRKDLRLIGLLLLFHFVSGLIVPYILLHPVAGRAGAFLETAAPMEGTIRLCVLMLFVGSACALLIAVRMWAVIGERQGLGLLVVALAATSFTLQLVEIANWLSLLSISQAYAAAAPGGQVAFETISAAAYATFRWVHYSHIFMAVLWLFSLYLAFHRAGLVPKLLAAVAMAGVPLHLIGIVIPVFAGFRMPNRDLFGAPLGVATIIIALWLIVKGGDASGSRTARD